MKGCMKDNHGYQWVQAGGEGEGESTNLMDVCPGGLRRGVRTFFVVEGACMQNCAIISRNFSFVVQVFLLHSVG